jgi:drug/metabolite transporter (DMT)-like permease
MPYYLGIIFAVVALFSWGFADFYIQKSSRSVGVWKTLFTVGVVGCIAMFPFIRNEFFILESKDLILLVLLGIVIFVASLFNFTALKKGKIAIVEPLIGIELPITIALSISIGREHLTLIQLFLIFMVFIGLLMVITMHHKHLHQTRKTIEKGVMLALAAAIGSAMTNFLVGISSRQISPLMVIWFAQTMLVIISTIYLIYAKQLNSVFIDLKYHLKATLGQGILYNLGWIAFAFATTAFATSIVTAVSESYIILGVIFGIFINRERLRRHQFIGIILVIIGILGLATLTSP